MRRKTLGTLVGLALCVGVIFGIQYTPDHKLLFEKAKFAMETKGDLQAAVKLFQEIVAKYPQEKEYAAKAQLYIGLCYEKLGNSEAVKAYELVLKNFADRPEEVAVARERLAALKSGMPSGRSMTTLPKGVVFLEAFGVSPDGTKIAGLNYDTGENIVVYDTVTNRTEFVTHLDFSEGSFWADVPVWSPDGKEIAYEQYPNKSGAQGAELRIADLEGKSRLLLKTEDGEIWPLEWLPKRSALICVRQHQDRSYAFGLVPLRGGSFRTLCPVVGGPWGPWGSTSPDERYLVFTEGQPGSKDIRVISIDGEWSRIIVDHPANDDHPLWSPDGKYIVFRSNRQGSVALWGLGMKDGQAEGEPFMIEEMLPRTDLLNWTSQGLAFWKLNEINDIFIQSIDPETQVLLGKPRLIPYMSPGNNSCLRWSPDGKSIAFVTTTLDRPGQVHIVIQPSEGGKAREFLVPVYIWDPSTHTLSWDSEGRRLGFATFSMNTDKKQASILILDIDRGEWKTYLLSDFPYSPPHIEWSLDGMSVFYENRGEVTDPGIIERNLETGKQRYVYRPEQEGNFRFSSLRCSRDHQRLVFHQENRDGPSSMTFYDVIALEIETGDVKKIYSGTDGVGAPVWSPDGRNLLVLSGIKPSIEGEGMGRELGIIPVAGGLLKKLKIDINWSTGLGFRHGFVSPDWSPDGKQIAFTARSVKEELFLMKNVISKNKE